jgi:protein SCO1/2
MGCGLWDNPKRELYAAAVPAPHPTGTATMASAHKSILFGMIAAFAAALGVVVATLFFGGSAGGELQSGTLLKQPRALPELQLTDQDGQPFTRKSLEGQWNLVFAGFTYCPDVCPTTLALLKQVQSRLAPQQFRVVFLSVDPERDTPERLKKYVRHFSADFVGVTAGEPQLAEVARGIGFAYAKVPGATPESYQMDHSAALALINPQGQIVGYFSPPFEIERLAADLRQIIGGGA